jgi:hypothetical protein
MSEQAPAAGDIYTESVERLRNQDVVSSVELLRRETFALLESVQVVRTTEEVESALPTQRSTLERLLAISVALLDHGGERGVLEVGWMLQAVATELGEREGEPIEPMLALALRDLSLSVLADCLLRSRLEPLPRIGAVAIPGRFERESWRIFQAANLRHPNALERKADVAYASWSQWLPESTLTSALTHVRDAEAYEGAVAEAELIAALAFANCHGEQTYCAVVGADGPAERRFRGHRRDAAASDALARFLDVDEGQLDETVNRLYSMLNAGGPFGRSRGELIIGEEPQ